MRYLLYCLEVSEVYRIEQGEMVMIEHSLTTCLLIGLGFSNTPAARGGYSIC